MAIRRWLAPALLVVLFGGVAVADLYRALRAPEQPARAAVPLEQARFEPDDYVLDFRHQPADGTNATEAVAQWRLGEGWGEGTPGGRWSFADSASLLVSLPVGGQRVLYVDCRPDRHGSPPRLVANVNGVRVAAAALRRGFVACRFGVPDGVLVAGDNRIELTLVAAGDEDRSAAGRTLLLRRLAVARAGGVDFRDLVHRRCLRLDGSRGRLLITAPGRLVMPFEVPRAGASLELRYHFRKPLSEAGCTLVVGRRYSNPDAVDVMTSRRLLPGPRGGGVVRVPLGHHTGASVLWLRADRAAADAGVMLQQPVLVAGDS